MHFVNELTSIGKINVLKSYIKNIFSIDYTNTTISTKTMHEELIRSLFVFIKQIHEIDQVLMVQILKSCWFYLEITIKSVCIYSKNFKNTVAPTSRHFSDDFYASVNSLFELLTTFIIKHASNLKLKDDETINAYKSCNRSLAMFTKVSRATRLNMFFKSTYYSNR
jgi:hypothetical protein